jgi:hypothetical protein
LPLPWCGELRLDDVRDLIRAMPALRALHADVGCKFAEAQDILGGEPEFAALHCRHVSLYGDDELADVVRTMSSAAQHVSLRTVACESPHALHPSVLCGLEALARAVQLRHVSLHLTGEDSAEVTTQSQSVPGLVRLLAVGSLQHLGLSQNSWYPAGFDTPSANLLAAALRSSRFQSLRFEGFGLFLDVDAAIELLSALVAHPSLRSLEIISEQLFGEDVDVDRQRIGSLLATLVAPPDQHGLEVLSVLRCDLLYVGLRPLCNAIRSTTRLRALSCGENGTSDLFMRRHFLPAVHANASLRCLKCGNGEDGEATGAALQAEQLVASRR